MMEQEIATHSSILSWRIPGTEEPGGLLSMGSHRVRHDWSSLAAVAAAAVSNDVEHLSLCLYLLWGNVYWTLPIFNWIICLFFIEYKSSLKKKSSLYFRYKTLIRYMICKYFFPFGLSSFEAQKNFFLIFMINCFLKKLLDVWIQSNIFLTHYENFHRIL